MRPEQITTFDDQVVKLIKKYQQENSGKPIPHDTLQEQFEEVLLEDQKFKSAEYLAPVLTNLKNFKRIKSNEDATGVAYEIVEQ
jgi:primosomal protein N''